MKRIAAIIVAFFCFSTTPSWSKNNTTKIWFGQKISTKLSEDWTLKGEFAERFENRNTDEGLPSGGGIDEWEEFFGEVGVDYAASSRWVLNGTYRYIRAKDATIKAQVEHRLFVAAEYKFKIGILSAGLRTRFVTRYFHSSDDKWRYRATETFRFSVPTPLKINDNPIQYFFYDELHIDIKEKPFNNNELRTGFKFVVNKNLDFDLYYGNEIRPNRDISNLVGLEVGVKF